MRRHLTCAAAVHVSGIVSSPQHPALNAVPLSSTANSIVLPTFLVIAGLPRVVTGARDDVFIRRTPITRFLFGLRPKPPHQPAHPVQMASGRPAG